MMPRWGAKRTAAQKREVGGPGRRPENSLNVRATALHTRVQVHTGIAVMRLVLVDMYLDVGGSENLSKRAETALNMCAPGVCRETQVLESRYRKKYILNFFCRSGL